MYTNLHFLNFSFCDLGKLNSLLRNPWHIKIIHHHYISICNLTDSICEVIHIIYRMSIRVRDGQDAEKLLVIVGVQKREIYFDGVTHA
jgi:hypothetical protein